MEAFGVGGCLWLKLGRPRATTSIRQAFLSGLHFHCTFDILCAVALYFCTFDILYTVDTSTSPPQVLMRHSFDRFTVTQCIMCFLRFTVTQCRNEMHANREYVVFAKQDI